MIKSPIQFVYVCVCRNTQKKLRDFVGFVDFKFKFCCEFRSWLFLNHSKWITSYFDGLNIPSYLAYSTFLVITNRDFYGLIIYTTVKDREIVSYCLLHIVQMKQKSKWRMRWRPWSKLISFKINGANDVNCPWNGLCYKHCLNTSILKYLVAGIWKQKMFV